MSVSGRVHARGPYSPRLWCGYLRFRRFLHLSDKKHVKKQQQKCVLCFAFLFGTVKTTLFPQILGKTCLFFPHFPKKRDLENPPQKMNPKFYQGDLSYRYTSYGHLFINFTSSNESKHPTRINYNHITKTNLGCRLGIGRKLVFLLGKHIFLFEKEPFHQTYWIDVRIRGEIFAHGFSGCLRYLSKIWFQWWTKTIEQNASFLATDKPDFFC